MEKKGTICLLYYGYKKILQWEERRTQRSFKSPNSKQSKKVRKESQDSCSVDDGIDDNHWLYSRCQNNLFNCLNNLETRVTEISN